MFVFKIGHGAFGRRGTWNPRSCARPHFRLRLLIAALVAVPVIMTVGSFTPAEPVGSGGLPSPLAWSPASPVDPGTYSAVSCASMNFCMAGGLMPGVAYFNGSTWTLESAPISNITSISCPSSSMCMAVNDTGNADEYTGSWAPAQNPGGTTPVNSVSCLTSGTCVAVDALGRDYDFSGSVWSPDTSGSPLHSIDAGSNLVSVSCPATGFCMSADAAGYAETYSGRIGSAPAWAGGVPVTSSVPLSSVSCSTAFFCMAVDSTQAFTYSGAWASPSATGDTSPLTSVSCDPAGTLCAAVDNAGGATVDTSGTWAYQSGVSSSTLNSVSCVSGGYCISVDTGGNAYQHSGAWSSDSSSPTLRSTDGGTAIQSVSCSSATSCIAIDSSGKAYSYSGTSWTSLGSIDGADSNSTTTVSCSSSVFCASVDASGGAVTFNGSSWSTPIAFPLSPNPSSGVSCPSAGVCVGQCL